MTATDLPEEVLRYHLSSARDVRRRILSDREAETVNADGRRCPEPSGSGVTDRTGTLQGTSFDCGDSKPWPPIRRPRL
jgi:hypothetical protein